MNEHKKKWTVLKRYDNDHLTRIALPVGGIGTGTVSLGGRGNLRDWEIMNRPAKNFTPKATGRACYPSIIISVKPRNGNRVTRLMEGPLNGWEYEGYAGCPVPNQGLPRFRECSFDGSYPFGRVNLADSDVPVKASIEAFNPFIPCDINSSSLPVAVLRLTIENITMDDVDASFCVNVPNFIGLESDARRNINAFRKSSAIQGIDMRAGNVDEKDEAWGTMALTTTATTGVSYRTAWERGRTGKTLLDFWDEFSGTGELTDRPFNNSPAPMASLAVRQCVKAGEKVNVVFLLTWHFPNRQAWTLAQTDVGSQCVESSVPNTIGNYYCTKFDDAWHVAEYVATKLEYLESATIQFVNSFLKSDLPESVKEGALFNLSTLRRSIYKI